MRIFNVRKFLCDIMFEDWKERIKDNPQVFKGLLWDVNTSKMTDKDWQKMKLFVVQRVVERGRENDYYAIFKLYGGPDGVREIIKQIRIVLDPAVEAFVMKAFDLKKENLIGYECRRLREEYLNSVDDKWIEFEKRLNRNRKAPYKKN